MSATNALAYSTAILNMAERTFIAQTPVGLNTKTFCGRELILPCNKLERFFPFHHFHPVLIFAGKGGAYPSGAQEI